MTTQGSIRFDNLSDEDLLTVVKRLALAERNATAQLVRSLGEIDARRLYLSQGCPSLFVYCTRVLQLSEHAAYGRIKAARAARTVPLVLSLLEDGAITLTTVTLLAAHLTPENCVATLGEARNKNKRQVEELVARLRPAPDVPAVLRKLPQPAPLAKAEAFPPIAPPTSSTPAAVACQGEVPAPIPEPVSTRPPATVKPLSPERYKLQVTLTRDGQEKLLRVRDLMRHSVPNGDLSEIVERAIASLLKELERTKYAAADRPRQSSQSAWAKSSRAVPAAVRRAVWQRDGARCAFIGSEGRCSESGFLEFHHVVPFAAGGAATVENVQLRCRAHNAYEAEQWFLKVRECRAGFGLLLRMDGLVS